MARTEIRGGQILDASVSLTADVTGTLTAANGGTGNATNTLNNVLLGNGTGALQTVAPSTAGKVLRSDGTTWASTALTAADVLDANANFAADVFMPGFTTTATAAGITTMTIADKQIQEWTGSTTQTIKLPTTSVPAGAQYFIANNSTGAVTVQSSGANTIVILAGNTAGLFTALVATPTTAANWDVLYDGHAVASGKILTVSNTLTLAGTDGTTMTFPASSDTVAALAAVQTITGAWSFNDAKLILNGSSSGSTTLKATAAASGTITLPAATDTLVGKATTDTLTNKWVQPRVVSPGVAGTYTVDWTNSDQYVIGTQNAAITNLTATGTAVDGQKLMLRIKGDATPRAITWDSAKYVSSGVATLLATTAASKTHFVGLIYDGVLAKMVCIAVDATGY